MRREVFKSIYIITITQIFLTRRSKGGNWGALNVMFNRISRKSSRHWRKFTLL